MNKAIKVLGLGAAAVAFSVGSAYAMDVAYTTSNINLREQPSATSNKVSELNAGTKVTIIENRNGWTKVKTDDGKTGWISGYYLSGDSSAKKIVQSPNENEAKENKDADQAKQAEAKADSYSQVGMNSNGKIKTTVLNIRKGPSTADPVVGKVYKGEIFKVVAKASTGWYKVVLNDGTTGWSSGDYIDFTNEVDKSNVEVAKPDTNNADKEKDNSKVTGYGVVNSSVGLNVRSGAGTGNAVIGSLAFNQKVNIISSENGWYKIKLDNGSIGYVGASYITAGASSADSGKTSDKNSSNNSGSTASSSSKADSSNKVCQLAQSLIGTPYSWGGTSTSGFDCSGFTQYVFKNALGVDLPRVSGAQATAGSAVSMSNIKPGDLLYFDTNGSGRTSHVGIYLGNGKFIHASGTAANPESVKVSNLSEGWVKCLGARRI